MNYQLNKEKDKHHNFLLDLKASRFVLSFSDAVSEVKTAFNKTEKQATKIVNNFIKA